MSSKAGCIHSVYSRCLDQQVRDAEGDSTRYLVHPAKYMLLLFPLPPVVSKVPQQKIIHAAFSQETAEAGLLRLHVADRAPWSWQPPSPPRREGRPRGGQQEPGAWGRCSWGCCCSCGVAAPGGLLLLGRWVAVVSVAGALTTFGFGSSSLKLI